jgi:N-acetylneuraminic acid mutarotase
MKKITALVFTLALVLSLSAQEWEQLANIPFSGRHHAIGFSANGKGYALTGTTQTQNASREFWEYTPETDSWERLDNYPGIARSLGIGDDWDGKYYFGFGSNGALYLNDLWVFDPADYSFTELPSCPCVGRDHPAFIAQNGKIFMGSGSAEFGDIKDWWVYDIATQEWEQRTDIPGNNRHHPFQFGIGDYVYVGGGHDLNWTRYDESTNTWLGIDNMPEGRVAGTQFSFGNKGYVLSGHDRFHNDLPVTDLFMEYDPELDEWEKLTPHPGTARWAPASFIIDGYVYLFSGMNWDPFVTYSTTSYRYYLGEDITPVNNIANQTASLSVYPNPVADELIMDVKDLAAHQYQLNIYDTAGRLVQSQAVSSNRVQLGSLESGLYLLQLSNEEGQISSVSVVKE